MTVGMKSKGNICYILQPVGYNISVPLNAIACTSTMSRQGRAQ